MKKRRVRNKILMLHAEVFVTYSGCADLQNDHRHNNV